MVDKSSDPGGGDGGLSRRELLVGAAASCSPAAWRPAAAARRLVVGRGRAAARPRRARPSAAVTFRLGVTGGGAKDIIDGQIDHRPSPTRRASPPAGRRCSATTATTSCGTDGLAEEAHAGQRPSSGRSGCKSGIEFNNGKTLARRRRHLLDPAHREPEERAVRRAGHRRRSTSADLKKMDKLTVRVHAQDGRLDDRRAARPVLQRHRPGRLLEHRQAQVGRHRPVHHARASRPASQSVHDRNPNYWRSGQPYFDQVTIIDFADPTAQVNALFSGAIDAMTDIPFAQLGDGQEPTATSRSSSRPGRRLAAALHGRRHAALRQRQPRPPGDAADRRPPRDARPGALGPRARRERPLRAVRRRLRLGAAAAPPGHRAGQVAAQGGRHGRPHGRPAHDRTARPAWSTRPTIFAAQAKAAGVTINVKNDPNYYGDQYLQAGRSRSTSGARAATCHRCARCGSVAEGAVQRDALAA